MEQLYDTEVTLDALYFAYQCHLKHKKDKLGAKQFAPFALHNLCNLRDEINSRTYLPKSSLCFIVKYPVPREIFYARFRDGIVQHFIYNELNPVIEKLIINDTTSCRLGKGTDYAIHRVSTFIRRESNNYENLDDVSYGKLDISGFFMSIDRQILLDKVMWVVDNLYKGPYTSVLKYLLPIVILRDVTKNCIRLSPIEDWNLIPPNKTLFGNTRGLPIGNITSQLFANFYLNDIDHLIKSRHKSYVRYVDDMIIVDTDKDKINETKRLINEKLGELGMKLNLKKSITSDVKYGIPFLGVRIYPYFTVLGERRITRLYYTTSLLKDIEKAYLSCASRKGMFRMYHGKRLSIRWYGSLPDEWKDRLKMDTDATFHLIGRRQECKDGIINICLYNSDEQIERFNLWIT